MTVLRRWRLFYLIVIELAQKYTKALIGGFVAGIFLSIGFLNIYPIILQQFFAPIDRIGIVGDFTPNELPQQIQKEISMGLTQIGPDGTALPALATSWVATDSGKTFTFFLRNDYVWHNKNPVEAKDVNYNIKNVVFTIVNKNVIRTTLQTPFGYSPFPTLLSKPLFQPGLLGFGPYRVSSIQLNGDKVSYLKLVPADTHQKSLHVKEYRFYRTEVNAILAYKLGDVDELDDLTSPYDLSHWGRTNIEEHTRYNRIVSLYFNLNNQFLQDKNIRHALAFATPQSTLERAISPIAKTSWAYASDKVKQYDYDTAEAKKLLNSAGVASQSASLTLSTFSQYVDEAQNIADSWSSIGIPTNVKVISAVPSDYQVLLSAQDVPPDPDQYPLWHSTQTQTNITGYANVKIDKLLEDGRRELDTESRKKIYADFQRRISDELPAVFLHYIKSYTVHRGH